MEQPGLFDFLNDIYVGKQDILTEANAGIYSPYVINMCLAGNIDTIMYAQQLNMLPNISKFQHFKYLLYSLPRKKRYSKMVRADKIADIEIVKEYYSCSTVKAKENLKLLTKENIEDMKKYLYKGGK